ncbi:MAG: extracellular solute-binding protein [Patescibacteria group bacterium]
MDDNNQIPEENQTKTLYETVSVTGDENVKNFDPLKAEDLSPTTSTTAPEPDSGGLNNKKKYFLIGGAILAFLILFFIVFRIFIGGSENAKEIQLTYWGLWEDKEVMQPLIDQYQANNSNIKVEYIKMTPEDYRNKLLVRSEQGQGPDIYRYHNTWVPEIKAVLSPLPDSILSTKEYEETFFPLYKNDLKVGDNYYGIPLMVDGLVLLYNDTLFKSAGINNEPKTWEDVINNISELTVRNTNGSIVTSGIAIGTSSNIEHFSDILGLFLLQNGSNIESLDTAEAIGALESFRRFAEPPNNYWDEAMPSALQAFVQEKAAMIIVPSWQILSIKTLNPELNFKVVPVPSLPGGDPVSVASYWVEGVSRYSEGDKQIEAWKFLKYLSEKETMTKLYELQIASRQFPTASSRVDLGAIQSQNEHLSAVIKQANYYKSIPTISYTFDNGLNDQINQYLANAINSTINGESYGSALKTAKEGVDQVINRYKNE